MIALPGVPTAIIFVNNDLTPSVSNMLVKQLYIDEVIDGYVFDQRIESDGYYLGTIAQSQKRLMVVRSFTELENRSVADVVIFVKNGMAAVETKKVGPPGLTFKILNLTWSKLKIYI